MTRSVSSKQLLKRLKKLFPKGTIKSIVIPMRKCQDVPRFLKAKRKWEKEMEKMSKIHFVDGISK